MDKIILGEYEKKFISVMKTRQKDTEALLDIFHEIRKDINNLKQEKQYSEIDSVIKKVNSLEAQVNKIQKILEEIGNEFRK